MFCLLLVADLIIAENLQARFAGEQQQHQQEEHDEHEQDHEENDEDNENDD